MRYGYLFFRQNCRCASPMLACAHALCHTCQKATSGSSRAPKRGGAKLRTSRWWFLLVPQLTEVEWPEHVCLRDYDQDTVKNRHLSMLVVTNWMIAGLAVDVSARSRAFCRFTKPSPNQGEVAKTSPSEISALPIIIYPFWLHTFGELFSIASICQNRDGDSKSYAINPKEIAGSKSRSPPSK